MDIKPATEDVEVMDLQTKKAENRKLIDAVLGAPDGEIKEASAAGGSMIRRRIREEGFTRRILPPIAVGNDDLDRVKEHDRPVMIEDMEAAQKGSKSIPFGETADTEFFYGNKFLCEFNEVTTPEFTKDINELRTYKQDLRQVTTDNALKDMQTEEDGKFIAGINTIVGANNGVGASGVQQNFAISGYGGITRESYTLVLNYLEDQNLNNGVILMNRHTAKVFLTFDRSEIGGDLSEKMFTDGLTALQEARIAPEIV